MNIDYNWTEVLVGYTEQDTKDIPLFCQLSSRLDF